MKFTIQICLFVLLSAACANAQTWQAKWISCRSNTKVRSSFFAYRKQVTVTSVPASAIAKIAVDSKYWLWINNKMVVREGGLKRGPNAQDTYYDEVDIAPYLSTGTNTIAIQLLYFGRDGYAHNSSGTAGLIFDCQAPGFTLLSDLTWQCRYLPAYQEAPAPISNSRLVESSIAYDATKEIGAWQTDFTIPFDQAVEMAAAGGAPWNGLVRRPIPFWKDSGLKNYVSQKNTSEGSTTVVEGSLPYNAQVNPYFKIDAEEGKRILVCTDNYLYYDGSDVGLRFEYITKKGVQEFELPVWLNGHKVYYKLPSGIKLLEAKYRETGYPTEFEGSFSSSDAFLNRLWEKAARTVYVCMRDNYMDCPDRERAQWTGDAVHEASEAAYSLSPSHYLLTKKWLSEMLGWQRQDGTFYAPIPSGGYSADYPDQTLSTLGMYGLWSYFMNTADTALIAKFYPEVKRYHNNLWELDADGLVKQRWGYDFWGDRTNNKDILVMVNSLYYMVLKCVQQMAQLLNQANDYNDYTARMQNFRNAFNRRFWNGTAYRHPSYTGLTDDRAQALAVVAGIADTAKYPAILEVLKKEEHASSYMEKYVTEALLMMGYGEFALQRHKKRYAEMVNNEQFTTLWEDWKYGYSGEYGGATVNHAWSGGGLILLSQYICGIAPVEAGYKTFQVMPDPSGVTTASATVSSIAGLIKSKYELRVDRITLNTSVPNGTQCVVGIKNRYERITVNGTVVWENGLFTLNNLATAYHDNDTSHIKFTVQKGDWEIIATRSTQAYRVPLNIFTAAKLDTTICRGDTVVLTAAVGKQYQWYKNDRLLVNSNQSFLNVGDSGYYYAIRKMPNGSADTSRKFHLMIAIYTVPPRPIVQLNDKRELVATTVAGPLQWSLNLAPLPGETKTVLKPLTNGLYSVTVKEGDCTSNPSDPFFYVANALIWLDAQQYITVFPNPATDFITLACKLSGSPSVRLTITDMSGTKLVDRNNVKDGDRIYVGHLLHGTYVASITTPGDGKQYSIKFLK